MNSPAKLIFREWKKPEVAYELHGWNPEKSLAFVFDDKGQPQVLRFVLPDQFNEHDRPTPAFPQHSPTDVTEIRLVPPPCRTDQAEDHTLRVRAKANTDAAGAVFPSANWDPSRWELVRLSYDKEILILRPEEDVPLADLLNKFKEEKRHEYAARKQELHMLLELVRSRQPISGRARYYAHIVSNGCEAPSLDSAAVWQHFLNQERIRLDIDFGQGGYPCGFLNWTPDDARRHPDIRDPYLQSRWAKENGLDLQEMADQRKCIYAWTGMADAISSLFKRFMATMGNGPESLQLPKAPSPAMLEMAKASDLEFGASIRFRVTFAEEHQEAWLTACRRRGPEPDELAEFGAAQERIVTLETIKGEQGQVLRKLNSVDKKTDQVLSGVQVLTGLAGEQAAARTEHVSAILALPETLTKAGQQARADVEAGASTLGARTKDLAETLGKVAEVFADPLVAAAKDASINRAVPPEFALWVFYERHFAKFPTVDGAYKRCGLGPKLEKDGFAFSRPTVGRWLKIIRDELEERKLIQKRNLDRGAVKARGFDVAQAKDTSPLPGDGDEPPDDFVEWTQEKHAAGAMPSEEDVLDWLCARTDSSILDSCSSDKLREIAKKWLRQAEKILDLDRTDPPEPEDDSDPEDDS